MKKTIVISSMYDSLFKDNMFNLDSTKLYHGASWVPFFKTIAESHKDVKVLSGYSALNKVIDKSIDPSDLLIFQEELADNALKLIKLGAKPIVLFCAESPLFAFRFYDKLNSIAKLFKYTILYNKSILNDFNCNKNNTLYFPSYIEPLKYYLKEWDKRKFMVLISENKYVNRFNLVSPFFMNFKNNIYNLGLTSFSKNFNSAYKNQLQKKRLEALNYFGNFNKIDLFGKNWDNISILPDEWKNKLAPILTKLKPKQCIDKIETMSAYKFAICFENTSQFGYITEKIIHCFIAGTIPVYLGAPDVNDFIPKELFIDMRDFKNFSELDQYLNNLNKNQALTMIHNAFDFIKYLNGTKYSSQFFANYVWNLFNNL